MYRYLEDIKKYQCTYCMQLYATDMAALACLNSHDLIYIPISRADVSRLVEFLYTKNENALPENFIKHIMRISRTTRVKPPELPNLD